MEQLQHRNALGLRDVICVLLSQIVSLLAGLQSIMSGKVNASGSLIILMSTGLIYVLKTGIKRSAMCGRESAARTFLVVSG